MIQHLRLTIFATLLLIFLSSCGLPKVTLHQIDTVHNVANPFRITNYNKETCEIEFEKEAPFPLLGPQLHGGVCLTPEDFAKVKEYIKADCKRSMVNLAE